MGTLLINNLRSNVRSQHYSKINDKKVFQLQKVKTIYRLKNFYIHKIIENKHLYMALKFRAVKVPLNLFSFVSSPSLLYQPFLQKNLKKSPSSWPTKESHNVYQPTSWVDLIIPS